MIFIIHSMRVFWSRVSIFKSGQWRRIAWVLCLILITLGTIDAVSSTNKKTPHAALVKAHAALVKEVKDLSKNLKETETRIAALSEQLGEETATDSKAAAVVTNQLESLTKELHTRLVNFSSDLQVSAHAVLNHPKLVSPIGHVLIALILSFCIAMISVGFGGHFLQHHLEKSIFRLKSKTFLHLSRLNTLLILPMPIYFCISILLGMALQSWDIGPTNSWHLNACALLPLNLYCVWAMYTWIGLIWMPNRPSQGFVIMRPEDAHRAAFWLRTVVGIYAFSAFSIGIIVVLLNNFLEKSAIIRTILDVGIIVSCWCIHKALSLQLDDVQLNPNPKKIIRALTGVRWVSLGLTIVWIMSRKWFLHFLFPVMMTAVVWLFLFPAHELLRYYRVGFLWKSRHRKSFFKPLLTSQKIWVYLANGVAYGLILYIWYPYVEQWIDRGEWTFLTSVRSVVFSGLFNALVILAFSIFIIKIGDRILRYYVEEKYNNDSLENNFLASRLKTLMAMLKTSLRVVVGIPCVFLMFSQFSDVNITTSLASIGAASIGLTFGLQHIVRDFITGFFIILENNLMVGDEVEVDARSGKVESISIRTLKIRSDQGMLLTIPFGNIQVIGNKNRLFSAVLMNISVGYDENLDRVQSLIEKAFTLVKRVPIFGRRIVGPLEIRGVTEVTSFSVIFQVKITTAPNMQDTIRRAFNRQLKQLFDEAGIIVPVPPYSTSKGSPSLTNTIL